MALFSVGKCKHHKPKRHFLGPKEKFFYDSISPPLFALSLAILITRKKVTYYMNRGFYCIANVTWLHNEVSSQT